MKRIIVLEGPAGSGKSTFCSMVESLYRVPVFNRVFGPRRLEDNNLATLLSSEGDHSKLAQALNHLILSSRETVLIDRLFFSQYVYGTLRGGNLDITRLPQLITDTVDHLLKDLCWRLGQYEFPEIEVVFIVLIPSNKRLIAQRNSSPKSYPWPTRTERELYRSVYATCKLLNQSQRLKFLMIGKAEVNNQGKFEDFVEELLEGSGEPVRSQDLEDSDD